MVPFLLLVIAIAGCGDGDDSGGAGGGTGVPLDGTDRAPSVTTIRELDAGADTARLCLYLNGQYTITVQPGGHTSSGTLLLPLVQPLVDRFQGLAGYVELTLGDDFVIPGGERARTDGQATWELRWSDLQPRLAPNDDLPT